MESSVYEVLRAQGDDPKVSRLLQKLQELALRVQDAEVVDGTPLARRPLLCPQTAVSLPVSSPEGSLPAMEGTSEFAAMQAAAHAVTSRMQDTSSRDAFRVFAMQPSNVAMVVQLGWLAYSSVQQPQAEPASTSSLREHVLQGLCHHYVTTVLPLPSRRGDEFQRLWLEATSLAAVQLLRTAHPELAANGCLEGLPRMLRQQAQEWITGNAPAGRRPQPRTASPDEATVDDQQPGEEGEGSAQHGAARTRGANGRGCCCTGPLVAQALASHRLEASSLRKGERGTQSCSRAAGSSGHEGGSSVMGCSSSGACAGRGGSPAYRRAGSSPAGRQPAGEQEPCQLAAGVPYARRAAASAAASAAAAQQYQQGTRDARTAITTASKRCQQDRQALEQQLHEARWVPGALGRMSNSIAGWQRGAGGKQQQHARIILPPTSPGPGPPQAKLPESATHALDLFRGASRQPLRRQVGKSLDVAAAMWVRHQGIFHDTAGST